MFDTIEKLLILQDRDRKIHRLKQELAHIPPERENYRSNAATARGRLETIRNRLKQIESERKRLELEVEAKKSQIEKYANQQLQTRKNEEYRALANEIENCKGEIRRVEDGEIELMEQAENGQKELAQAAAAMAAADKNSENEIAQLDQREQNLKKELEMLEAGRAELAAAVEEPVRNRYERLFRSKGDNVVVGVAHGVCGGCHMKLPAQVLVTCRSQKQIVSCINCGRILYYSRDMEMAPV
ncbi:MAG: hypothetical protein KGJ88_09165 [Verrucomicrobiota bacterium]|nr:hypothetical protein [Verrucomicrobiota bacterium]